MSRRSDLYPAIAEMRGRGLKWREIGERLGISLQTAYDYGNDPDGSKAKARKMLKARPCLDCGKPCNKDGSITNPAERCTRCHNERSRAMSRRWVIDSMREWREMFGEQPTACDWNQSQARAQGAAWRVLRYEETGRIWPTVSLVQTNFGSWNEGLIAAGFAPLAGNYQLPSTRRDAA